VVLGYPHHITQRGVCSIPIFSSDKDRSASADIMAEQLHRFGVEVLAWCLMTNHTHFFAAARYVDLNPVKAGMVRSAEEYPWSSARFHLDLVAKDVLVKDKNLKMTRKPTVGLSKQYVQIDQLEVSSL